MIAGIDFRGIAYLIVLAFGGVLVYQVAKNKKTIGDAASAAIDAINPASDKNVVNQAANKIVQKITGDDSATVGTKLAEYFSPAVRKADALMAEATRKRGLSGAFIGDLPMADDRGATEAWREALREASADTVAPNSQIAPYYAP